MNWPPVRLAERVGFEPTEVSPSPDFKAGALNRSAIFHVPDEPGRIIFEKTLVV